MKKSEKIESQKEIIRSLVRVVSLLIIERGPHNLTAQENELLKTILEHKEFPHEQKKIS